MKTIMYTVYDEQQILKLEEGESDGSVRPLEDDSDDESEDVTNFLDLARFPVPDECGYRSTWLIRKRPPPRTLP